MSSGKVLSSDDTQFLRHEPCPKCGSSDAVAVYKHIPTGGETKYCFSCGGALVTTASLYRAKQPGHSLTDDDLSRLNWTAEAAQRYRVTREGLVIYYGFAKPNGKLVGVFKRDYNLAKSDDYHFVWHKKPDPVPLYGMDTVVGTEELILCTGLNDAVSANILTGMNAVSVPNGDRSVKSAIEDNFQWLRQFRRIFLIFDNDASGQAAAEKAMELLGFRAINVVLPDLVVNLGTEVKYVKDATDFLKFSLRSAFTDAIASSLTQPTPYIYGEDADEEYAEYILAGDENAGWSTGISEVDEHCRLRENEITVFFGSPGRGKSTFARHIITALVNQGVRPYYLSLEDPVKHVISNLRTTILKEVPATTRAELLDQSKRVRDRVLIARIQRPSVETFEDAVECAIVTHGCRFVMLDHITILVNLAKDPRSEAVAYMNVIVEMSKKYPVHFFIVSHNKPLDMNFVQGQKGKKFTSDWEEKQEPTLRDAQWSSAFEQLAWNIWGWRNPDDTEEPARLYILKNRTGGMKRLGKIHLYFDEKTKLYMDSKTYAERKTISGYSGNRWDENPVYGETRKVDNRDILSPAPTVSTPLCSVSTVQDTSNVGDRAVSAETEEIEDFSDDGSTDDRGGSSVSYTIQSTYMEPRLYNGKRLHPGVQRADDERFSDPSGNLQIAASVMVQKVAYSLSEAGLSRPRTKKAHLPSMGGIDRSTVDVLRPDPNEGESGEYTGNVVDEGSTSTDIWGQLKRQ